MTHDNSIFILYTVQYMNYDLCYKRNIFTLSNAKGLTGPICPFSSLTLSLLDEPKPSPLLFYSVLCQMILLVKGELLVGKGLCGYNINEWHNFYKASCYNSHTVQLLMLYEESYWHLLHN